MVRSITSIAKAMGKETIAEFVESEEIKQILIEMDVDYIQGYHVEKPRPLEDYPFTQKAKLKLSQQGF
jgi:EAL domain-containing protein (putative c-di-GMP-specific phosphodiesterase class I)